MALSLGLGTSQPPRLTSVQPKLDNLLAEEFVHRGEIAANIVDRLLK